MTAFWKFFIRKEHFTVLLMIVLVLAGVFAALAIPKESSPEIKIPIGVVTILLPGASANDVEQLITNKVEDRVLSIENVSKVTSSSNDSASTVIVQFEANADIDKSIQLLRDAVDSVKSDLPTEAQTPIVSSVDFTNQPIIIASVSGNLAAGELTALGQSVQDDLKRVPDVSKVDLSGIQDRQVQVVVQQAKLKQYNIPLSTITSAIAASGIASPEGSITVDGVSYNVRLEAGVSTPEEVRDITFAGPGGAPLHVYDVADVVDGLQDSSTYSRVSVAGNPSQPALTLSIYKSSGGNVLTTGNAIKAEIAKLQKTTLSGTKTVITYDGSKQVKSDLTELTRAGLETVVLVIIILLLTLGWRESLVAAASIPLSFLIAFIGLYASGNTINFISLFSLILAIGILVDSGIVVVEAIHTHLERSGDRIQAATEAIHEYAWPLVAGTFTTIAVFIPLFFLSGIVGKYIASIPYTIIFVLLASIFVALGLVPLLAIFFVRPATNHTDAKEKYMLRLKNWYQTFLRNALTSTRFQNYFLITMGVLFVVALALPVLGLVKTAFLPADNSDTVYVQIEKPQGTELARTDIATREVEEILYTDKRIESFVTDVGEGSALTGSSQSGSQIANITVSLKSGHENSTKYIDDLRAELAPVKDATVTVSEPQNGPSSGAPVTITFSGTDLAALTDTVEKGAQTLATIPGTTNVTTSTRNDSSEFVISLDQAKAADQGVSPGLVASTLRTALYGTKATSLRSGSNDIDVYVRLDLNAGYTNTDQLTHTTIDSVRALTIPGAQGPVPLSSIAAISYAPAQTSIAHEDGKRIVTLSSDLTKSGNATDVSNAFQKKFTNIPSGVTMKIGGETEDINNSFKEMILALIAGAALMLAILVLEFNSFRQALYLLLIIPLSLIGVLSGLLITGSPLSFPSMLGVIALAGVIINHAIILMDSIARIGRAHPGQTLTDVVVEAASLRLRPIVLTTVTTVIGMVPLIFASAIWGPLAVSIMFGLSFSMILTLVLIPVLYHRWPGKKVKAQFSQK